MPKPGRGFFAAIFSLALLVMASRAAADEYPLKPLPKPSASVTVSDKTAEAIKVVIDFAKVLTLDGAAKTIVIGNPGILDATINDERTLVLTGKSAGTTNMIVLGEGGKEILNAAVRVIPGSQMTTVYQGSQRRTYLCVSTCTPVLSVGDEPQHFEKARTQIQVRQDFATGHTQQ